MTAKTKDFLLMILVGWVWIFGMGWLVACFISMEWTWPLASAPSRLYGVGAMFFAVLITMSKDFVSKL